MQTMKDTKIKWLGEIPDSWQFSSSLGWGPWRSWR